MPVTDPETFRWDEMWAWEPVTQMLLTRAPEADVCVCVFVFKHFC